MRLSEEDVLSLPRAQWRTYQEVVRILRDTGKAPVLSLLAKRLGVSKTSVWDTLRRLEDKGLVVTGTVSLPGVRLGPKAPKRSLELGGAERIARAWEEAGPKERAKFCEAFGLQEVSRA